MSKANFSRQYDAIFFSPHLDDAVLSAGGYIAGLIQKRKKVLLVTFFTTADEEKRTKVSLHLLKAVKKREPLSKKRGTIDSFYTLDQKAFLKESGIKNPQQLFLHRKKEDQKAAQLLGCDVLHFSYTDAFFRKKRSYLARKENAFLYPTFKHLFSGTLSLFEKKALQNSLKETISSVLQTAAHTKTTVFAPLGIGLHIDHISLFDVLQKIPNLQQKNIFFWADIPYRNHVGALEKRIAQLHFFPTITEWHNTAEQQHKKKKACLLYKTQIHSLFRNGLGDIDFIRETFFQR